MRDLTVLIIIEAAAIAVLLGFSFLFSASETALFSLSPLAVEKLKRVRPARGELIFRLLSNPRRLLISIVVGNMLVNIGASTMSERITSHFLSGTLLEPFDALVSTLAMTFLILIFGETCPKTLTINHPERFSLLVAPFIDAMAWLTFPIRKIVRLVSDRLAAVLEKGLPPPDPPLSREEIATAVRLSSSEGLLDGEEREMITEIFRLGGKPVRQLMTPRSEIVSFEARTPLAEIAAVIKEREFSRIPVYFRKPENIIGVLYPKDVVMAQAQGQGQLTLAQFLRKPFFVPHTMKASRLLKEFLQRRVHIALVVDEYGGLSGLITLDDLIVEIVGEIRDKGSPERLFEKVDGETTRVMGRAELDEVNRCLGLKLFSKESVTLGGYLSERLGRLPQAGDVYEESGGRFEVISLKGTRVGEVLVRKPRSRKVIPGKMRERT